MYRIRGSGDRSILSDGSTQQELEYIFAVDFGWDLDNFKYRSGANSGTTLKLTEHLTAHIGVFELSEVPFEKQNVMT